MSTSGGPPAPTSTRAVVKYDTLMDLLLEHPEITTKELSAATGYNPSTISVIINSDAFKARLAERRKECTPYLAAPLAVKARVVASIAMERLAEKAQFISDPETLLKIADKMAAHAEPKAAAPTQQTNVFMVSSSELAQARQAMLDAARLPPLAAEGQPVAVQGEGGLVIDVSAEEVRDADAQASDGKMSSAE